MHNKKFNAIKNLYDTKRENRTNESLISQKQQEIRDLRQLVGEEMIADFYETHNLKEGQHFYFNDKECVGVEMSADWGCLKTFPITAKGRSL